MRLVLATLSFFVFLAVLFGIYLRFMPPDAPGWLTTVMAMAAFVLALVITNRLVNVQGTNFWSLSRAREPVDRPAEQGLIADTAYRAVRCFRVEASGEGGPHYFIELWDKSVLYLNGSYLAAYEPRKVLGLINITRKFPCTEFIIQRDRYEGEVVGIQCRGTALEPELFLAPFEESEMESVALLRDGDVVTSRTYEELKTSKTGNR